MEVRVYVKPGSSKGSLVQAGQDGQLTVYVRERAIDGKANEAALAVLAQHYHVAKTHISLVRGAAARYKVFRIVL